MSRNIRTLCLLLIAALLAAALATPALAVPTSPAEQLKLLREIDKCIYTYYLESDGKSKLPAGLTSAAFDEGQYFFYEQLDKLMDGLDKYSVFYESEWFDHSPPEEPDSYGIGVLVDPYRPFGTYIYRVLPGGSAEEQGLRPNDQIVSVDGKDVRALELEEIISLLRGRKDTQVRVGIRRPGALEDQEYTLTRRALLTSYVTGHILDEGIGYIQIESFEDEGDVRDFARLMDRFGKQGVKDLIIDLRDNPGGTVDVARDILCLLDGKPGEALFTLVNSRERNAYSYERKGTWSPDNVIVLVNEYSASSSEIMAGSLKDRGRATLLGTKTYGKARAQSYMPMFSGDMLVLTMFRVELPVTGDYHTAGLQPDAYVELTVGELDLSTLAALEPSRAILPGLTASSRVLALEQRLSLMGYFLAEPDGVFDAYTLHALNGFQMAEGLTVTRYGSVQALELLESYMEQADGLEYVAKDNQLEYAIEMLGKAS